MKADQNIEAFHTELVKFIQRHSKTFYHHLFFHFSLFFWSNQNFITLTYRRKKNFQKWFIIITATAPPLCNNNFQVFLSLYN